MEQKQLTNWQAVGIGAGVGFVSVFSISSFLYVLSQDFELKYFQANLKSLILIGAIGALFGIVGALTGNNKKGTKQAVWKGAIRGVATMIALLTIFAILILIALFVSGGCGIIGC